jgi:hypothetical protein
VKAKVAPARRDRAGYSCVASSFRFLWAILLSASPAYAGVVVTSPQQDELIPQEISPSKNRRPVTTASSNECALSSTAGGAGLSGPPMRAPLGSVSVTPGGIQAALSSSEGHTSFLLQPGIYLDGTAMAKSGDAVYGEGKVTWIGGGQRIAIDVGGTDSVLISGINFTDFSAADNGGNGIFNAINGSTHFNLEGNTLAYNQGTPIYVGNGSHIWNNCIHDNGAVGIQANLASNVAVSHNEIFNNDTSPAVQNAAADEGYASGIKFFQTTNALIEYNNVHNNQGVGVWFDTDNTGSVIDSNYIVNNASTAIIDETSQGAIIRNNVLAFNGRAAKWISGAGIFISTASNVEVYGNIINSNAHGGILVFEDSNRGSLSHRAWATTDNYIHDNYITMPQGVTAITGGAELNPTNLFTTNHYCFSGGAGFMVGDHNLNQTSWRSAGYDIEGTFDCGF